MGVAGSGSAEKTSAPGCNIEKEADSDHEPWVTRHTMRRTHYSVRRQRHGASTTRSNTPSNICSTTLEHTLQHMLDHTLDHTHDYNAA